MHPTARNSHVRAVRPRSGQAGVDRSHPNVILGTAVWIFIQPIIAPHGFHVNPGELRIGVAARKGPDLARRHVATVHAQPRIVALEDVPQQDAVIIRVEEFFGDVEAGGLGDVKVRDLLIGANHKTMAARHNARDEEC